MNKQEAIQRLKEEAYRVKPGQEFEIRRMEPEDAWGVARCFFAVYGEHYPFDTYYVPEKLIEENRRKNVFSIVARTASGDIIGHGALYKSSAYNPKVYEFGQALIIPEYRCTFAVLGIQDHILNAVAPGEDIDEIFGEPVCNHIITQRLGLMENFVETGLEVGLMPAEAYPDGEFPQDRISTLLGFRSVHKKTHNLYIPKEYGHELECIVSGMDISRNIVTSEATIPSGSSTTLLPQSFDQAQVARFNLPALGQDFPRVFEVEEAKALTRGSRVLQVFVNLGEAWCGHAITLLRAKGYFFGGLLPRWFDTDGLLMQKLSTLPRFDSIKLYSDRARMILDLIRRDIEGNPACREMLNASPGALGVLQVKPPNGV